MKNTYNIICITGPTASGKTSLSVKIARRYGCSIISGDSRQVFRGMDIGTGKDIHEYISGGEPVPFYLIDTASPSEDFSLYRYLSDFNTALEAVRTSGNLPLLAGGSGLYIEAALKGYALPDAPEDRGLRSRLNNVPREQLESMLQQESEEIYNRTDLSSSRRIIRGIETAKYMKQHPAPDERTGIQLLPLIICIRLPRDELVKRIDSRLEQRIEAGLVEEVRNLLGSGVTRERMLKLGLEYRYVTMYIHGELSFDEMTERLKTEIHRFAKRQMTWFRGMERRGLQVNWINGADLQVASEIIDSRRYLP